MKKKKIQKTINNTSALSLTDIIEIADILTKIIHEKTDFQHNNTYDENMKMKCTSILIQI